VDSSIDATLQSYIWFFHKMTNRTTVAIVVDDSVCSADVQKQENNGTPHKKVVKQGNILKDSETSGAYCVVALLSILGLKDDKLQSIYRN
jgi:hypothetical protein